jgi:hypothetical protein
MRLEYSVEAQRLLPFAAKQCRNPIVVTRSSNGRAIRAAAISLSLAMCLIIILTAVWVYPLKYTHV